MLLLTRRVGETLMIGDSVKLGEGEYSDKFEVNEGDTTIVTLPLSFTYAGLGTAGRGTSTAPST